jgi:flagellar biosynthesis protein FlhF
LFDVYTRLIEADVEHELARDLVSRLQSGGGANGTVDAAWLETQLEEMIEASLPVRGPIPYESGHQKVVALVGSTGVGKTTTIAKLAAHFRLRERARLGLITVDTYRIAAVEQLRTYAEIIDLPMKVVMTPREMSRALAEMEGLDLILLDTAGRSPSDDLKIQELKSFLTAAAVHEVHLVLSAVSSSRSLLMTAKKFAPARPTAVVLTKLDEAAGLGGILKAIEAIKLPISYVTTGQNVPDDIELANARRLARLILGREGLDSSPNRLPSSGASC